VWCCGGWPCAILACVYYFKAKSAYDQVDKIALLRYNSKYKITAWIGIIFVLIILISAKYRIGLLDGTEWTTTDSQDFPSFDSDSSSY